MDNKPYFHNKETFPIRNRQKIEEKYFYWLISTKLEKILKFRFQREEIFAISDNFN